MGGVLSARRSLLKKTGIINKDLSEVIAGMGHLDMLVVCDAGLPIPRNARRIDLALKPGSPSFLDTVNVIAQELEVERLIVASEIEQANSHLKENLIGIFAGAAVELVTHDRFKELTRSAVAVVRTGEFTPYANVILVSGVYF